MQSSGIIQLTTTLSGREIIWAMSWDMIRANPWLGVGPMHFAATHNAVAAHPHNALLQLAAEWGIPATALVVTLVFVGFWKLLRTIRANSHTMTQANGLRIAIFASLVGAAVQSMVDGVIVMPTTMVWTAILVGWAWGLCANQAEPLETQTQTALFKRVSHPLITRLFICAPFMAAACMLLYTAGRDVPKIIKMQSSGVVHQQMSDPLLPRFWVRGFIASSRAPASKLTEGASSMKY